MAVQKVSNNLIYCLAADTKPTVYADNTLAYVVDTGDVYRSTGGVWNLIQGASKAETLTNKTILQKDNTVRNIGQINDYNNRRPGMFFIGNVVAAQNIGNWTSPIGGLGSTTTTYSSTDGWCMNCITGAVVDNFAGAYGGSTAFVVRSNNPYCKITFKMDSTATGYFFAGWRTSLLSNQSTMLANADSGAGVGYRASDTNLKLFHNDGSGAMIVDDLSTPTAKTAVTSKTTLELSFNNTTPSFTAILNDSISTTITTRLPAASTLIGFQTILNASSAVSRTISMYNGYMENG